MVLIAILFCLALQRFVGVGGWFKISWFEAYLKWLSPWLSKLNEKLMVLFIIAPVLLVFVLIQLIFTWYWFGLVDLILAVMVLLFCIDARDLKDRLKPYFEGLEKSDMHAAAVSVNDFISDSAIGNIADLRREVTRAILLNSFTKLFAGLFWFIVFGVYGVAAYTLIVMLSRSAPRVNPDYVKLAEFAEKIQNVLEWLPARLLGFSYALVGHFNKGFSYCAKNFWKGLDDVRDIAIDSGLAALDLSGDTEVDQSENVSALDMINRVLIIWVVGVALITIGIWF